MLDAPRMAYLKSEAGAELLAEAAALSGSLLNRLTRLRRRYPPDLASAALELLELRARAAPKFSRAAAMFFTPEGLEQSSSETIARWRAARFPTGATVLDLCCGIGGDALALGAHGQTLAFDFDSTTALCARANACVYDAGATVAVACADVTKLRLRGDAAFFDPSRRREGRRVREAGLYSPPLEFLHTLCAAIPDVAVKVSPALDDGTLDSFGGRVEFVSDRGECKEAVLWFGALGPDAARSATLLPASVSLAADPGASPPPVTEPRAWLYEPDAAVVRAHLMAELAERLQASQVDPQIAYLTADRRVDTPYATAYRVIEWLPFNLKRVQARLRALGRRVVAIKRRGVPLEPAELAGHLTAAGDLPAVVVLTRIHDRPAAILCEE